MQRGMLNARIAPGRAPTELEQRLAQRIVRSLLDELHDAWEPLLAVNLSIDRVESDAQRVRVVAPGAAVVVLAFQVRLAEQTGSMSLCLPQRAIQKMVDKLLVEVEAQLEQKGVQLHIDDAAREWMARKGYDPKMGARPMARVIQEAIKRPLAEELLFGRLVAGGHAFVTVGPDDQLKVEARADSEQALLEGS